MSDLVNKIKELINPVLLSYHISECVIDFNTSSKDHILSILIDTKDGVDLELCVKVSEEISAILDKYDPIKEEYLLEVASLGAERPINSKEDFKNHINDFILVHTNKLIEVNNEGYDELVGYLREVNENDIVLEIKIKTRKFNINIDFDSIIDSNTTVNI